MLNAYSPGLGGERASNGCILLGWGREGRGGGGLSAYLGPQMKRWPGFLWHFEHVFLPPTHTQSESLMHGLSFFHGHLDAGDGGSGASPICHFCEAIE